MTTFETLVNKRLQDYEELAASLPGITARIRDLEADGDPDGALPDMYAQQKQAREAESDKIEYLLKTVPFIEEFGDGGHEQPATEHPRGVIDSIIEINSVSRGKELFGRYLYEVEGKVDSSYEALMTTCRDDDYVCTTCGASLKFDTAESSLTCESCGRSEYYMEMSSRNQSYEEEVIAKSTSVFSYDRLNHMVEWLNSIQAKEKTEIPEDVLTALKNEFKKQGTVLRKDIKPTKVKAYLKKLGMAKYYEHVNYITSLLNGVPAPSFPSELEDKLKKMFMMIQKPFEKHRTPDRKNFMSYSYTLYKFCELLGEDSYLKHFSLLKSSQKLFGQDAMWKKICEELDWEFIASI